MQLRTNSSKVRVRIILYSFLALSVEIEIVDQQIKLIRSANLRALGAIFISG